MKIRIYETAIPSANEISLAIEKGYTHLLTGPHDHQDRIKAIELCQGHPSSSIAAVNDDGFTKVNIYPLGSLRKSRFYFPKDYFYKEAHAKLNLQSIPCVKFSSSVKTAKNNKTVRQRVYDFLLEVFVTFVKQLKISDRPVHSAFSLSLGVFIGCSPFYGLQTLFLLFLCPLLRLNLPLAILGSQISLPPIYALILPAELYIGFQLLGGQLNVQGEFLELAQAHFLVWFTGFLILGTLLAFLMGILWWLVQQVLSEKKSNLVVTK